MKKTYNIQDFIQELSTINGHTGIILLDDQLYYFIHKNGNSPIEGYYVMIEGCERVINKHAIAFFNHTSNKARCRLAEKFILSLVGNETEYIQIRVCVER